MKFIISFLLLLSSFVGISQNSLSIFEPFVNKTWKAEGTWGDGSKFIQETTFSYSLDKSIVIANSIGFVDKEQSKLGPRNHGIRQFDDETGKIQFWEFVDNSTYKYTVGNYIDGEWKQVYLQTEFKLLGKNKIKKNLIRGFFI